MKEIELYSEKIFDDIKHVDEYGNEYWLARELMKVLQYAKWDNFVSVIEKAKMACELSGKMVCERFADVGKTIKMPKGAIKVIDDYKLSRYACYCAPRTII